jgi:tetratricopeptide (TPR) repeat protein
MPRGRRRFARAILAAPAVFLFVWWGWPALQANLALVALNRLPSVFSTEVDAAALAAAETQLEAAAVRLPARASTLRALALVRRAQGEPAAEGISPAELVWWGRQKQQAGDLDAARYLFEWATELQPELGDAWYYAGGVYQAQAAWDAARSAFERAAAAGIWQTAGPSDAYLALGDLAGIAPGDADWTAARDRYRQALELDRFGEPGRKAAAHYRLGELLLWDGGDPEAAIPHYRAALAIDPGDQWARLRLGYALYWGARDLAAAEATIITAIDQWTDERYRKWPYFYLAEIYADAGRTEQAVAAYEQVLALDPADERVRERLAALEER